jgi:hypothetical protein
MDDQWQKTRVELSTDHATRVSDGRLPPVPSLEILMQNVSFDVKARRKGVTDMFRKAPTLRLLNNVSFR